MGMIEEMFQRMAFNLIAGNHDDQIHNILQLEELRIENWK